MSQILIVPLIANTITLNLSYLDNDMKVAQYVVRMQAALVVYSGAVEVLYKITWYFVQYAVIELQS